MRFLFILIFILSLSRLTYAIEEKPVESLNWEKVYEQAFRFNPDLAQAKAELDKSVYENRKVYAEFLPQINATASYRRSENLTEAGTGNRDPLATIVRNQNELDPSILRQSENTGPFDRYAIGLSADQNLFAGLKDMGALDRTESLIRVNRNILEETKLRVGFELASSFYQTLFAQELITLSETILERRIMNRNMVKLRFEGGREHKGSYLLSEAAVKQAEYDLEQAKRLWNINSAELVRVMGGDEKKLVRVQGKLSTPKPPNYPKMAEIANTHPIVAREQARVKAAQAGITIADSQFYPSLGWNASIAQQEEKWLPQPRSYSFGVAVSYPLFQGGRDYYNSKIARKEHERSRHQLTSTRNQLLAQLEDSFQNFTLSSENVKVLENFFEAAETRAMISRAQYSNGLLPFENWDIIENDLIQRQRALLSSRRDAKIAEANWKRTSGEQLIP